MVLICPTPQARTHAADWHDGQSAQRVHAETARRVSACQRNRRTSAVVKVCGCRPHDGGAAHTGGRRTQTSNGGNRGKGYVRRCGVGYRELSTARNFDFVVGGFSKDLGLVHNFCVMAQGLLPGENRFLSPCDFKELRVIKRARFTTSTLAASQRSLNSIARTDRRESRKNSTHAN